MSNQQVARGRRDHGAALPLSSTGRIEPRMVTIASFDEHK